jgi:hypothetical protein
MADESSSDAKKMKMNPETVHVVHRLQPLMPGMPPSGPPPHGPPPHGPPPHGPPPHGPPPHGPPPHGPPSRATPLMSHHHEPSQVGRRDQTRDAPKVEQEADWMTAPLDWSSFKSSSRVQGKDVQSEFGKKKEQKFGSDLGGKRTESKESKNKIEEADWMTAPLDWSAFSETSKGNDKGRFHR